MKRIELVMEPSALDRFTETARAMNLSDFDVTEVRRSPSQHRAERQRVYRGHTFTTDLEDRIKVDLNVPDGAANRIAHGLIARVNPESVVILMLDQTTLIEEFPPTTVTSFSRLTAVGAR